MLDDFFSRYKSHQVPSATAYVLAYDGASVEIGATATHIGATCKIKATSGLEYFGEIIKIGVDRNVVSLYEDNCTIAVGDEVHVSKNTTSIAVGSELLGRVIDSCGNFLDALGDQKLSDQWPLHGEKINPATRQKVSSALDVGIRSINAALTLGKGQRIGIFAGSGVGKSSLISMITDFTQADVIVVGLIGERGREVSDFVQKSANSPNLQKTIIVAEPADSSPLLRLKGVQRATAISEYFREQGKDVLLILDSLTRVAHAQREIGLSRGEAPITKGYTPSVLNLLPKLIERAGCKSGTTGSITAIYTVLADGDDLISDPIVDTARAILDGHIVLSRSYAQHGIFPAIDLTMSVSRIMNDVVDTEHVKLAERLKTLIATYFENRDLVLLGGYTRGQNTDLDLSLDIWPQILDFLKQDQNSSELFSDSYAQLSKLLS